MFRDDTVKKVHDRLLDEKFPAKMAKKLQGPLDHITEFFAKNHLLS